MEGEYITFRKRRKQSSSLNNLSNLNTSLLETTILSLPDTSIDETFTCLNDRIKELTMELQSAHKEIDDISCENRQLRSEVEKCNKIIQLYKKIGVENCSYGTPNTGIKKNRRSISTNNTPIKFTFGKKGDESKNSKLSEISQHSESEQELPIPERLNTSFVNNETNNHSEILQEKVEILRKITADEIPLKQKDIPNIKLEPRRRILILADQQGRGTQKMIQKLTGSMYEVTCFSKPGATLKDILRSETTLLNKLNYNDVVIIIGGINEKDPYEFQLSLNRFFYNNTHTNILVTEVPHNRALNENKLNYDLRFMCGKLGNVSYVHMDYSSNKPKHSMRIPYLCQTLLKDILRLEYQNKINDYKKQMGNRLTTNKYFENKYTQTEDDSKYELSDNDGKNGKEIQDENKMKYQSKNSAEPKNVFFRLS